MSHTSKKSSRERCLYLAKYRYLKHCGRAVNYYFWRTYDHKEIDLIEERGGRLHGYEFKWAPGKGRPPREFLSTYKNSTYQAVNRDNYLDFIAV